MKKQSRWDEQLFLSGQNGLQSTIPKLVFSPNLLSPKDWQNISHYKTLDNSNRAYLGQIHSALLRHWAIFPFRYDNNYWVLQRTYVDWLYWEVVVIDQLSSFVVQVQLFWHQEMEIDFLEKDFEFPVFFGILSVFSPKVKSRLKS